MKTEILVDVRHLKSKEEKEQLANSILKLGWKLDITFHRLAAENNPHSIVGAYLFTWHKDTNPIFPNDIEYQISKS
ncbi:hypothetical protein [Anaerophilus nitritogenes]|uniref:hypothetical protein n=1 Tax=Anaerophilus nitritogenes TaxID=2498136 RepID=UPI00101DF47B|nr:hypothetical protein [Anaerophilus nitritogenes]